MEENKWHNRIMHLTSFSLGVVISGLMISQGLFNEMIYVMMAGLGVLFISFIYQYIRGIDYMVTNHPDYDGEDMYGEEETQNQK
jgi:hypothetical protein